ncbi:MAG TPA: ABC transporter ATP-binding protein [Candidatus Eisenbacteria bacterium]|nr:ABC transporter ATP-binding protein [Candidatus Eisenbacteria bacterium]
MTDLVIETRGLRKQFGAKVAVQDLSLGVRRGEVFGFLGPNGAGKTTSVKMLLGLVEPTSGSGAVLGARLGNRAVRARLGFLPEHFRFQDWLTGRELLLVHGGLLGMRSAHARERADALLARVDLLDAAHRPIRTYSKGMMQRVGLAQALLGEPDLVFLDEPTSGLDPLGRLLVRDVIRELRDRGTTVFLNSHLLGEVEATCSRVTFVKEGRTLGDLVVGDVDGSLEVEIRSGSLTGETLEAIARIGRILEEDAMSAAGSGEARDRLRVSVPTEERLPELARALVQRGLPLYEMRVSRKSLEASFLEVMGEDQRPG